MLGNVRIWSSESGRVLGYSFRSRAAETWSSRGLDVADTRGRDDVGMRFVLWDPVQ
jgi:hypothetical protein